MAYKTKQINFGKIDHFLYVRINCLCADLDYNFKDLVEQAYCILTELIDEKGITHFHVLQDEYHNYSDYRERTRYSPRMIDKKHAFVVDGIHEEIHEHLVVIKEENGFPWSAVLQALFMTLQLEIDKEDRRDWKDGEIKTFVVEQFLERRGRQAGRSTGPTLMQVDTPHHFDVTKKRRKYEETKTSYPEGEKFRSGDED